MKPMTEIVTQYYTLFVLLLLLDGIVVKKKKIPILPWTRNPLMDTWGSPGPHFQNLSKPPTI